ncbi:MAG: hypothetical protein ACYC4Q_02170 [Victivallaceae bacterium]
MSLQIKFDIPNGQKSLANILQGFDNTRPLMKTWAVAVADQNRLNATAKGGRTFWVRRVRSSVREVVTGEAAAEVFSDSKEAAHKQFGGIIRPTTAKFLAIPVDKAARGKYPREISGLFLVKTPTQALLCLTAGRGGKQLKVMYVLKKSVMQKPEPWWTTDPEIEAIGRREAAAWLAIQEAKANAK